jgi:hypothetical protein
MRVLEATSEECDLATKWSGSLANTGYPWQQCLSSGRSSFLSRDATARYPANPQAEVYISRATPWGRGGKRVQGLNAASYNRGQCVQKRELSLKTLIFGLKPISPVTVYLQRHFLFRDVFSSEIYLQRHFLSRASSDPRTFT